VSDEQKQAPLLDTFYQSYLTHETSAHFVAHVSRHYTLGTLTRLAVCGSRTTRRAAVLGIGFLGGYECNRVLGGALHDEDRVVRLLAENSIRDIWCRDGSPQQQHWLQQIMRWNNCGRFHEAARGASQLIREADGFAEAWNQRAIAYYQLERFSESVRDCRQTLERNPVHFAAAVGLGHCYLEMFDAVRALDCFRWALQVNPDMENVRAQVGYLQRTLEGS
jgi:tetratricopeptide (TPR) repeat protein